MTRRRHGDHPAQNQIELCGTSKATVGRSASCEPPTSRRILPCHPESVLRSSSAFDTPLPPCSPPCMTSRYTAVCTSSPVTLRLAPRDGAQRHSARFISRTTCPDRRPHLERIHGFPPSQFPGYNGAEGTSSQCIASVIPTCTTSGLAQSAIHTRHARHAPQGGRPTHVHNHHLLRHERHHHPGQIR
jgi:hypothetical protein